MSPIRSLRLDDVSELCLDETQAGADGPAREKAAAAGNNIITLTDEEVAKWREAAQPVYDKWIADMEGRGIDGKALIAEAQELIAKYSQ